MSYAGHTASDIALVVPSIPLASEPTIEGHDDSIAPAPQVDFPQMARCLKTMTVDLETLWPVDDER